MTQDDAIKTEELLLKKNPYTYLQPEHVTSFEAGYRSSLFNQRLKLDLDFYYNIYKNLMAQIDANIPKSQYQDSIGYYLLNNSTQDLYRLWTNSKTISYNYGVSFGTSYELTKRLRVGGNVTYARLSRKAQSDGLEDAFNTPKWTYNLFIASPDLYKGVGFSINYRQQASYLWQSALATGNVDRYTTLDCQITANLMSDSLRLKLGATNLTNQYYYSFIGGPAIGGFYYMDVAFTF
jgi:iron complex outermembrane receptor protein